MAKNYKTRRGRYIPIKFTNEGILLNTKSKIQGRFPNKFFYSRFIFFTNKFNRTWF